MEKKSFAIDSSLMWMCLCSFTSEHERTTKVGWTCAKWKLDEHYHHTKWKRIINISKWKELKKLNVELKSKYMWHMGSNVPSSLLECDYMTFFHCLYHLVLSTLWESLSRFFFLFLFYLLTLAYDRRNTL